MTLPFRHRGLTATLMFTSDGYKIVLRHDEEGVSVSAPGLPGCWSQGATEEEASSASSFENYERRASPVPISSAIAQLRTTDLAASIHFYTAQVGLELEFQYEDFYAGIRAGNQLFHLKLVDEKDPSIDYVDEGGHFHLYLQTDDATGLAGRLRSNGVNVVKDLHDTAWGTREFVVVDDQGHTLYFAEAR